MFYFTFRKNSGFRKNIGCRRSFPNPFFSLRSVQSAFFFSALLSSLLPFATPKAAAQVAISLGAQEMYDDNIFLEKGDERPAFLVADDLIEDDIKNDRLRSVRTDEIDGKKDDDFITNLLFGVSGVIPVLPLYLENVGQIEVGFLGFADYDQQNRLTLDGLLKNELAKTFLPQPYYAELINELVSQSGNASVASGTASRTSEVYRLSTRIGAGGIEIAPQTTWGLGYTGLYNVFLGELLFEDQGPSDFEEEGSDFHSHTAGSELRYSLSPDLDLYANADYGVQIYTSVDTNDIDSKVREAEDLDRTNATGRVGFKYQHSETINSGAYVGVAHSNFFENPEPKLTTVLGTDGQPVELTVEREDSETSLLFGAEMNYLPSPGNRYQIGIDQAAGNDIDGERITTRSVYVNSAIELSDRWNWTVGGRYFQFSTTDDLSDSIDRFEGSTSLNFLLTQQTALLIGYNYVNQDASGLQLEENLFARTDDYEVNRVFVGINVGFYGLAS